MGNRKITIICHKKIYDYWANQGIDELDLNFDWADAMDHCWNCGCKNSDSRSKKGLLLERCHIIPHALGGRNTPDNYVLMCKECHASAPNINDKTAMWDWIKSNKIPFGYTGTYKIMKAFQRLAAEQNKSVTELVDNTKCHKTILDILRSNINEMSTHMNNVNESTYYYMLKDFIKKVNML
jgi:hypothetical protein